ncbi:MAG: hypothetical protein ACK55I_08260, partial [bacterium]
GGALPALSPGGRRRGGLAACRRPLSAQAAAWDIAAASDPLPPLPCAAASAPVPVGDSSPRHVPRVTRWISCRRRASRISMSR